MNLIKNNYIDSRNSKKNILVILESAGISDNKLRGVRKLFAECNGCRRVTNMVYLVPHRQWARILQLIPRPGLIMYYTKEFEIIKVDSDE